MAVVTPSSPIAPNDLNEPSPSELEDTDQTLDVDEEDSSRWFDTEEPPDPCEMYGSD